MIGVRKVHELEIGSSSDDDHPPHVSAASSLVRHGGQIFVVADDEYSLLIFEEGDRKPGHFMRILEGELPQDKERRQKEKADLESLALLPPSDDLEHGSLLALGSGSSEKRNRGVLVPLGPDGRPTEKHHAIDLLPLFGRLAHEINGLNIEGAEVVGQTLWLMQRGNEGGDNALVNLSLDTAMRGLLDDRILPAEALRSVDHVDLGQIKGVRLSFSDASALPDGRIVFAASAEDSDAATSDGANYGSALGVIEADRSISFLEPVDLVIKIEGIDARAVDDSIEVLMVTDADDPSVPSPLLEARIPAS